MLISARPVRSQRSTQERLYLETLFASLVSYGTSTKLLAELLPLEEQLNAMTIRNHLLAVSRRPFVAGIRPSATTLKGWPHDRLAPGNLRSPEETVQSATAIMCDPALTRRVLGVVEAVTGRARQLPSGAGHDAAILARLFPVAMLFVRCREGLSHRPDEYVSLEDIGVALQVTVGFLRTWKSK
jgi:hypothetical protein